MADDTKAAWLNWLAITTIIFSASATLSTFKGSSFSTRAVLAQTGASNQWAYFQSKSVKQHTCELQRDAFQIELAQVKDSVLVRLMTAKLADIERDIARYDAEKTQISDSAKTQEQTKLDCQRHGAGFGLSVVYLQVAIMFSALAALLKKKFVWGVGLVVGAYGMVHFGTALWMTFH